MEVDSPPLSPATVKAVPAQDLKEPTSAPGFEPSTKFAFDTPTPTKPVQPSSYAMPRELQAVLATPGTRMRHEGRLAMHAATLPNLRASGGVAGQAGAAAAAPPPAARQQQEGSAPANSVAGLVAKFRACLELLREYGMTRVKARGSGASLHEQLQSVSAAMKSLQPDAEPVELKCVDLAIQDLDALIRQVAEERLARSGSFSSTGSERTLLGVSSRVTSTDSSRVSTSEDAATCSRASSFITPPKPTIRTQSAHIMVHSTANSARREPIWSNSSRDLTTWPAAKPTLQTPPVLAIEANASLESTPAPATQVASRYVSKRDAKKERKARAKAAAQALTGNAVESLVGLYSPRAGNVRRSKLVVL